jgi:hypothetical protein
MGTTATLSYQTRITLAQDIRRTFVPGLRYGAIQGMVPIIILLALIFFFPDFIFIPLFPFKLYFDLLPLLATVGVDVLASWRMARRTYSVRAGLLTCLWANLWFVVGSIVVDIGYRWYLLQVLYPKYHVAAQVILFFDIPGTALRLIVFDLIPAIVLSLLCGGISGWLSLRGVAMPIPTAPGAPLPVEANQLAAQNQLGMPVRVHVSAQPSRALATGVGTIVLVTLLFMLQRFVLHVTGGDIFVDAVVAITGAIVTINQAYKRQGQQVVVYQYGLLVPSGAHGMAAIRWEELDPHQSRLAELNIILVMKNGFRVVLPSSFADFGELKATISAHMQQAGVRSMRP